MVAPVLDQTIVTPCTMGCGRVPRPRTAVAWQGREGGTAVHGQVAKFWRPNVRRVFPSPIAGWLVGEGANVLPVNPTFAMG